MTLTLDFSNMIARGDAGGDAKAALPESAWSAAPYEFARAQQAFDKWRDAGVLGFLDLPTNAALLRQSTDFTAATNDETRSRSSLPHAGHAGVVLARTSSSFCASHARHR